MERDIVDVAFTPALELAERIRAKEISPVELVQLYAERIDALNPKLNACVTTAFEQAHAAAREAEATLGAGDLPPFHGVPIVIKDLTDTAGIRSTHGTAAFSGRVPDTDAEVVRRLKRAGFIVIAKTNTPEFGTTPWTEPIAYGPARNPWNPDRTPGGSSGGSAAAVAAGLAPIGHGTDGGGSIRIPASCCGLVGLKTSRGRISRWPGHQSFLSVDGPLTRTVADAAAMTDAMAGYGTGDRFWAPPPERPYLEETAREPGRLRVAFTTVPPLGVEVAPGNREAVAKAAAMLEALGHDVEEATPEWGEELPSNFVTVWYVFISMHRPTPPVEELEPLNQALIELARKIPAPDYEEAWMRMEKGARRIVGFFDRYDVLVTPSVATPPPLIGEFRDPGEPLAEFFRAGQFVPFTQAWNVTGQPAVSLPLHTDDLGMPVGVQFTGRPADEATLIRLAAQIEGAHPWAQRRPPVS